MFKLIKTCPNWSKLFQIFCLKLKPTCPKQSKPVQSCPNLSKLVQTCPNLCFQVSIGHIILSTGWSNGGSCPARASWRIFLFFRCGCSRTGRFRLVKSWQQKVMEKIPICLEDFWSLLCSQGKKIVKRLGLFGHFWCKSSLLWSWMEEKIQGPDWFWFCHQTP